MSVRAKMKCEEKQTIDDAVIVRFRAVTYDTDENKTWAKYTPAGELTLTITNESAHEQFEQGKEYLLTFEPVS